MKYHHLQGNREGGVMIMRQNRVFATPSTPHPGQPKPNPAYLDQYGGCCKRFWGPSGVGEVQVGRGMTVLVSNLGTQNRDFTVLIWVRELLPSRSEMVRSRAKVKLARVIGVR